MKYNALEPEIDFPRAPGAIGVSLPLRYSWIEKMEVVNFECSQNLQTTLIKN